MFRFLFRRRSKPKLNRLVVSGRERSFLLYPPARSAKSGPLPLILALHGGGGTAEGMARATRLHETANRKGYLVVYPAGTNRRGRRRRLNWNAGGRYGGGWAERRQVDDIGFIRALVGNLQQAYDVDPRKIYATGISKGGMLAYRLACEMADVFAAVAVVAGAQTADRCRPSEPVAVLHIHGDRDQNVPLAGGRGRWTGRRNSWPPVKSGIEFWQRYNGCAASPREIAATDAYRYWRYADADGRADVDFCLVNDCGHTWPGVRRRFWQWLLRIPVSDAISASEMIVRFFEEHPKRPRR